MLAKSWPRQLPSEMHVRGLFFLFEFLSQRREKESPIS